MPLGSHLATPRGSIVSIDFMYYRKTFKHQYLQSKWADLDQITHTALLGSRKECILVLGRSYWHSGCHDNIYVLIEKYSKIFFSETTGPTALIVCIWQWPMVLYIHCANHAPGVKFGHVPGVDN